MQFQFTEVANIQEQIAALTEQLQQLTASIAPYAECEAIASELVAKVEEHRSCMRSKGLAEESLANWAIALYKAGSNKEFPIVEATGSQWVEFEETDILKRKIEELIALTDSLDQELQEERQYTTEILERIGLIEENEKLEKEVSTLHMAANELEKKLDFFKNSIRETDSIEKELATLRKENEDYQARFDGIKAQLEQAESERSRLAQELNRKKKEEAKQTDKIAELLNFGRGDAKKARDKMTMITWEDIERACESDPKKIQALLDELATSRAVLRKELSDRIELLLVKHAIETGDKSCFQKIPQVLRMSVERKYKEFQEDVNASHCVAEVEIVEEEETKSLQVNDIVSTPSGGCGTVESINKDSITVRQLVNQEIVEATYQTNELVWVSSHPGVGAQEERLETITVQVNEATTVNKYVEFMGKITRSTVAWNNLTWEVIRDLCDRSIYGLDELRRVKLDSEFERDRREMLFNGRIAKLLLDYIDWTGDSRDLAWISEELRSQVEALLGKKPKQLEQGVVVELDGQPYKVLHHDTDTGWVDLVNGAKKKVSAYIKEISVQNLAVA